MTRALPPYPPAHRTGLVEDVAGVPVADPYRWLEDTADPATLAWTAAQEDLYAAWKAGGPETAPWRARLADLFAITVASVPKHRGELVFRTVRRPGADHAVLFVREKEQERALLDPAALDPTGGTVLEAWEPSPDGTLLAVQLSVGGTEDCLLRVLDVRDGDVVDGPIDRVRRTPIAWLPDGSAFYYVRRLAPELIPGEERYHRRVYRHAVGADPATDVLVFGDGRERTQFYTVTATRDGRRLILTATAGSDPNTELWLADLAKDPLEPRPVQPGTRADTGVWMGPDTSDEGPIWLRTDLGAPRGRLMAATVAQPAPEHWRELIPQRPDAVLVDFAPLHDRSLGRPLGLAVWTRHAASEITVHELDGGEQVGVVGLPGLGMVEHLTVPPDGGAEAWFRYSDHATPPVVLRFDARTGETTPWPDEDCPAPDHDVCCRLVEFAAPDGTAVGMFVLSPTGQADRPRPAILTGYGGFGISMSPGYLPHANAWVRAGGVYAIACLRGGGEEGRQWHEAGRGAGKQTVFDDFAAAADALVGAGWTTRDRLGIMGQSNGGLLVGAALTQHPEKFAAAASISALLDMVRYERSGLGPSWRAEYGSADVPEELRVLLSYSPYHRVEPGTRYPPTLLTVADGDTRVDPSHARKMCAALQHASTAAPELAPILLRVDRGVGHGNRSLAKGLDLLADVSAFLGGHLGLSPGAADAS